MKKKGIKNIGKGLRKKIIIAVAAILCGVAATGGIIYAVSQRSGSVVKVIPVSSIMDAYYGQDVAMSGKVTSSETQKVQLSSDKIVKEVFVKAGETVNVGTPLFSYDTTMVSLNLESEKLNKQSLELQSKAAEKELAQLQKTKPVQQTAAAPADTRVQLLNFTPDIKRKKVLTQLDDACEPYRGTGTQFDPFCFWVQYADDYQVPATGAFLNLLQKYASENENCTIFIEMRDENRNILASLLLDGSTILDRQYSAEETYQLSLVPTQDNASTDSPDDSEPADSNEGGSSNESSGTSNNHSNNAKGGAPDPSTDQSTGGNDDSTSASGGSGSSANTSGSGSTSSADTTGYTKEELAEKIQEKKQAIKNLALDIRQSELKIKQIQKELSDGQVKSTVKGTVKTVGDVKNAGADGSPFIEVVSEGGLYIKGTISELLLSDIKVGSIVTGMGYQSGVSFEAEIRDVSIYPETSQSEFGGQGGNSNVSYYPFTAYVAVDDGLQDQEDVSLQTTVAASQDPAQSAETTIYLQKAYVRKENGHSYVYVADENQRLTRRAVQTGKTVYGYSIAVLSGLSQDDRIAFPYGKNVKEGARVEDSTVEAMYE